MLTYHTGVFVQWDHQAFGTIMELAWLWGATGYKSKANWHADKNAEGGTTFAAATPPALVAPWDNHRSEIRVYDVPMRDAAELAEYMKRFSGVGERFFVPAIVDSAPVRLTHRSQPDLCTYLTNYLGHDGSYHESSRNCQTFTADLFGFLVRSLLSHVGIGVRRRLGVTRYHPLCTLFRRARKRSSLMPKSTRSSTRRGTGSSSTCLPRGTRTTRTAGGLRQANRGARRRILFKTGVPNTGRNAKAEAPVLTHKHQRARTYSR